VQIYNFFERTLKGSARQVEEPDVMPEPDAAVQVGKSGNTVRDFASKTPLELARARLPGLKPGGDWSEVLSASKPPGNLAYKVYATARGEGCSIQGIDIESAPNVFVPAWLFLPRSGQRDRVLLTLEPRGRNGRWREGDLWHRLASEGWTVCSFDVRGLGDMWPEVGRGNPFYTRSHAEEEHYAWASLMLGKPLLGQRVTDILAVAEAVRGRRTVLAASGHTVVPAICAAALDPGIDLLYTAGGLRSWISLFDTEDYGEPFANFVPRILHRTDLPALRRQLGSRLKEGASWDVETLRSL
jgi:hypothetical protein